VFDQDRAAPETREQTDSPAQTETPAKMHAPARARTKDGAIVGRLAIPRLHVRAMVREGDGERTLSIALGHIPGTALPGQDGNVGIAGHRDTLFRGLKNIAASDEITVETAHGSYLYRVESTQIVKPEHVEVLAAGPEPELTLVTCFPFEYVGSAPDRFIVKARLFSENAVANEIHDEPRPVAAVVKTPVRPAHIGIAFDVPQGHSRELIPGKIWFGLSSTDALRRNVNGWVWVMPERRTIWLRDVDTHQPVIFYQNGEKREIVITTVAGSSASGYLVPSPGRG
jgi:sortase A